MNTQRITVFAVCAVLLIFILPGCSKNKDSENKESGKLRIVTTLFPLYDFARTIAGNRGEVILLMPPGMEPHTFEPKPDDIVRIHKAGLFIYTNRYLEPWAERILKGVDSLKLKVVNAGNGVNYQQLPDDEADKVNDHGHKTVVDPHIWLDFGNDMLIADNILAGFIAADPANEAYYKVNAAELKSKLAELDRQYRNGLASCSTRVFLHGGHYAFGYLARRYGLDYRSLSGITSEYEPSATRMTAMVRKIKLSGAHYLFAEALLSSRLTESLASEAGVGVLKLHGAHNVGLDDYNSGVTFIGLMGRNLVKLQKGLGCSVK